MHSSATRSRRFRRSRTATEKSTRWGPTAARRGGAGTPRERADLLASLLKQAGFQASVVAGDPDGDLAKSSAAGVVARQARGPRRVETLLAFNYTPVTVNPDQQFAALGCSIGSGVLGSFPGSYVFKQVGVATLTSNFFISGTVSTVVGNFSFCNAYSNPGKK